MSCIAIATCLKPVLTDETLELVLSTVEGTVQLVRPVLAVPPAVAGAAAVDTEAGGCALELPGLALVLQAGDLVRPVTTVTVPVTPSPGIENCVRSDKKDFPEDITFLSS